MVQTASVEISEGVEGLSLAVVNATSSGFDLHPAARSPLHHCPLLRPPSSFLYQL